MKGTIGIGIDIVCDMEEEEAAKLLYWQFLLLLLYNITSLVVGYNIYLSSWGDSLDSSADCRQYV